MDAPSYRLNAMQALMRRFAELAPYNFIHLMRVAGAAQVDRWREAATHALAELCLGAPHFDGDRVSFAPSTPAVLETPQHSLDHHLDAELNRPFLPGDAPVRLFVIEGPDNSHWFGIVLDHWIADDHSCRQLMQRIFLRYYAPEKAAALPPLRIADAPATGVILPTLRSLPTLFRQLADHRQAFRVSLGDPQDFTVRTFQHRLPDGLIQTIQQRAREHGATVHDFFLAACAQACGEFRRSRGQGSRTAVSLATVADLRQSLERERGSENPFGCLLSYYTSTVGHPEDTPTVELVREIKTRTTQSKKNLPTTAATLHLARFWWDRSKSARGKATLFQRSMPNVCGLSNVNLIGSWIEQAGPVLRDYRRVGPAGPIAPLIFMLTSMGDRLTVEVTYRTTAFTREDAGRMTDQFSQFLQALSR